MSTSINGSIDTQTRPQRTFPDISPTEYGTKNTGSPIIITPDISAVIFPFNFAHFGDIVPEFLHFLSWITNDISWILLAIGLAGGIAFVGVTTILYIKVKALLKSGWKR